MKLTLAAVTAALVTACTPHQVAVFNNLAPDGRDRVVDTLTATHNHPFLVCVRRHESGGDYQAQNPTSSASGAFQFIDSTWRNMSGRAGHHGYARAKYAPWWVQDAVAMWTYRNVGASPWAGSGCR